MNMKKHPNEFFEKQHMSVRDLQMNDRVIRTHMYQKYLSKNITDYPTTTEFHITGVAHVTNETSLPKIWKSGGFSATNPDSFLWWSLNINEEDITAAEERYLEKLFPDRDEEERAAQLPFLSEFTTSPAFNKTSRYGNFRVTFPLTELMEAYKQQKCDGQEPVLRVFGTKLFKQEIEYVVLVHSPQCNEQFRDFPLLTSTSSPVVAYDGHQIIWKAQAICETHHFQLETSGNTVQMQTKHPFQFYVWDHVSLVFHTKDILTFPKRKLKASLSCCKLDPKVNLSSGLNYSSLEAANNFLKKLTDDEDGEEHT